MPRPLPNPKGLYVTWLVRICATWLLHTYNIMRTQEHSCVMWLVRDMTPAYLQYYAHTEPHVCEVTQEHSCVTWLVRDMTPAYLQYYAHTGTLVYVTVMSDTATPRKIAIVRTRYVCIYIYMYIYMCWTRTCEYKMWIFCPCTCAVAVVSTMGIMYTL